MRYLKRILVLLFWFFNSKKLNCSVSLRARLDFGTDLEGANSIAVGAVLFNTSVGYATFIGANSSLPNAKIGRYCSIAHEVEVLPYTHPVRGFVSTHPAFYSKLAQAGFSYASEQCFDEFKSVAGSDGKISCEIGNDVWVGAKVLIMGGVKVGDGAVIAAGAVVTKDVPDYSIVAGVPAKVIGRRFSESEIVFLKGFKWWDRPSEWIANNSGLFLDISRFVEKLDGRGAQ